MTNIPKINEGFTNKEGVFFPNVREIAFLEGELYGNLGKLVAESNKYNSSNRFFGIDSDIGVYIYRTFKNPNVAYRIYKCFADYGFNGYKDDILIQNLFDRSKTIESVKIPTGVVTLDGRIIGQEIPFFSNCCTLYDFINLNLNVNPVIYYELVLKVVSEMYNNGIIYSDLHSNNFMVYLNKVGVEVIDFELSHIKFDDFSINSRINLLRQYKRMIEYLNYILGFDYKVMSTNSFGDMENQLVDMKKRYEKKNI